MTAECPRCGYDLGPTSALSPFERLAVQDARREANASAPCDTEGPCEVPS